MSYSALHRDGRTFLLYALICAVAGNFGFGSRVVAQDAPIAAPQEAVAEEKEDAAVAVAEDVVADVEGDGVIRFSFEGEKWRDVIGWLAESSDLALHVGDLPTGSFTYSDPNEFTVEEAIDRINLFLLPEGFTLVRSGKLLSVINLGDPRGIQQLDALAKLVTLAQLEETSDHDVVKCIFPLGELDVNDAVEELRALNLITSPAVFSKTNQLMITDTGKKLKVARAILAAFEPDALNNGTVIKSFTLQHVDAEDVLVVARPHLGLATGEMIGIDVSLSADIKGKNIFVTGIEDKVKLIEGLVKSIDVAEKSLSPADGEMELVAHDVQGGNVEMVYNVLVTLLAGKEVRLSMDETAGSVVALATPDVQKEIAATVEQLQASELEFAKIQLKNVDPYFVVSLLEEMFDLASVKNRTSAGIEAFTRHGNSRGLDIMDVDDDIPRIDADPGNMQLFVRAKPHQIEKIKKIVAELDAGSVDSNDELRIYPLRGKQAERMLETAAKFWREQNPIFYFPPAVQADEAETERVVANDENVNSKLVVATNVSADATGRLLTNNPRSDQPAIRCQVTPRGLLLQSEDTIALDKLEELLRTITGPADTMPSPPIVFYLKYTKPDDALRMLAELLDGGQAAKEGESGTLVNGYVSGASSTFLSSIVSSREGTMTMMAGTITVVADSRLNRLIAQGTSTDIENIEGYLKIVDKDNSITAIETYGTSHVIELAHVRASEVADAIRQAYGERVSGGGGPQPQQQGSSEEQAQRDASAKEAAKADAKKGNGEQAAPRKSGSQGGGDMEPKMTLAVHESSNSLIVTAPEQLFKEVEALAMLIDSRSEKTVEIIRVEPGLAQELQELFSGEDAKVTRRLPQQPSSPQERKGR